MKKTRIISFVNQKGGVGKTTTVINTAAALASEGSKVLIVDFDTQSNTTDIIVGDIANVKSVSDCLFKGGDATKLIVPTTLGVDVDLIPSDEMLMATEVKLMGLENNWAYLKNMIDPLKGKYDYILIDCPPSLGVMTINALCASTDTLIPVKSDYLSLSNIGKTLTTIKTIQNRMNTDLDVMGIIINNYNTHPESDKKVIATFTENFDELVFSTKIQFSNEINDSFLKKETVFQTNPKSTIARKYVKLAKELQSK